MAETDWQAHYRCTYCRGVRPKADIIHVDDNPICRIGDCKEKYYEATHPRPVPRSYSRFEHG